MAKFIKIVFLLIPVLGHAHIGNEKCFKALKGIMTKKKLVETCRGAGLGFSHCMDLARKDMPFKESVSVCLPADDDL